jgi:hypothetical protein
MEQYLSRTHDLRGIRTPNDYHDGEDGWESEADSSAMDWLAPFVEQVGDAVAARLLQGAGEME